MRKKFKWKCVNPSNQESNIETKFNEMKAHTERIYLYDECVNNV